MELLETLEGWFKIFVQYGILFLELAGVLIIIGTALRCVVEMFRKSNNVRLTLAQGISMALEFKLGGEVLRTVIVREWSELAILGAIIVLRGILTFLIHWEIKNEESRLA